MAHQAGIPELHGYRGVYFNRKSRRWQAGIAAHGRSISLGAYEAEEEAARVYDRAAIRIRGHKAAINFPLSDYLLPSGSLILDLQVEALLLDAFLALGSQDGNVASGRGSAGGAPGAAALAGPQDTPAAIAAFGDLVRQCLSRINRADPGDLQEAAEALGPGYVRLMALITEAAELLAAGGGGSSTQIVDRSAGHDGVGGRSSGGGGSGSGGGGGCSGSGDASAAGRSGAQAGAATTVGADGRRRTSSSQHDGSGGTGSGGTGSGGGGGNCVNGGGFSGSAESCGGQAGVRATADAAAAKGETLLSSGGGSGSGASGQELLGRNVARSQAQLQAQQAPGEAAAELLQMRNSRPRDNARREANSGPVGAEDAAANSGVSRGAAEKRPRSNTPTPGNERQACEIEAEAEPAAAAAAAAANADAGDAGAVLPTLPSIPPIATPSILPPNFMVNICSLLVAHMQQATAQQQQAGAAGTAAAAEGGMSAVPVVQAVRQLQAYGFQLPLLLQCASHLATVGLVPAEHRPALQALVRSCAPPQVGGDQGSRENAAQVAGVSGRGPQEHPSDGSGAGSADDQPHDQARKRGSSSELAAPTHIEAGSRDGGGVKRKEADGAAMPVGGRGASGGGRRDGTAAGGCGTAGGDDRGAEGAQTTKRQKLPALPHEQATAQPAALAAMDVVELTDVAVIGAAFSGSFDPGASLAMAAAALSGPVKPSSMPAAAATMTGAAAPEPLTGSLGTGSGSGLLGSSPQHIGLGRRLFQAVTNQLPPDSELDCLLPPRNGFVGVLYTSPASATQVGAALWDGATLRDLGLYSSDRDARQSVNSSSRLLAGTLAAAAAAQSPSLRHLLGAASGGAPTVAGPRGSLLGPLASARDLGSLGSGSLFRSSGGGAGAGGGGCCSIASGGVTAATVLRSAPFQQQQQQLLLQRPSSRLGAAAAAAGGGLLPGAPSASASGPAGVMSLAASGSVTANGVRNLQHRVFNAFGGGAMGGVAGGGGSSGTAAAPRDSVLLQTLPQERSVAAVLAEAGSVVGGIDVGRLGIAPPPPPPLQPVPRGKAAAMGPAEVALPGTAFGRDLEAVGSCTVKSPITGPYLLSPPDVLPDGSVHLTCQIVVQQAEALSAPDLNSVVARSLTSDKLRSLLGPAALPPASKADGSAAASAHAAACAIVIPVASATGPVTPAVTPPLPLATAPAEEAQQQQQQQHVLKLRYMPYDPSAAPAAAAAKAAAAAHAATGTARESQGAAPNMTAAVVHMTAPSIVAARNGGPASTPAVTGAEQAGVQHASQGGKGSHLGGKDVGRGCGSAAQEAIAGSNDNGDYQAGTGAAGEGTAGAGGEGLGNLTHRRALTASQRELIRQALTAAAAPAGGGAGAGGGGGGVVGEGFKQQMQGCFSANGAGGGGKSRRREGEAQQAANGCLLPGQGVTGQAAATAPRYRRTSSNSGGDSGAPGDQHPVLAGCTANTGSRGAAAAGTNAPTGGFVKDSPAATTTAHAGGSTCATTAGRLPASAAGGAGGRGGVAAGTAEPRPGEGAGDGGRVDVLGGADAASDDGSRPEPARGVDGSA
ncbi:hypothetical protein Agub_g1124 [Astrephomene gubernaculifera]|uniref:AP2/ERF domain-containing protein n=1 Tax=Astrephomene gubernaculifera TaxID=47775 RepID=A0AAD3HGK2_9CHLO|nr:hypothetical protein Agub_g1124 [Astrephomene gubernaculifera]